MHFDAETRRRELLEQETYDESWTARWKQKPETQCHPIVKLMAQIIFGLQLLYQQQAKSDVEVAKILQSHVDEIDSFLERTTEDFDLALKDIQDRIGHLKLPMTHLEVFDVMLDDRRFRNQLVEGNDKIETIIERTAKQMNAALFDIQKGVNTTQQMAEYLDTVQEDWPHNSDEQTAIIVAMRGNEEGWRACLRELQSKGNRLGVALVQLGTVVGEMSKLAAAASRRNMVGQSICHHRYALRQQQGKYRGVRPANRDRTAPHSKYASRNNSHSNSPSRQRNDSMDANKPLPRDPDAVGAAVKATIAKVQPTLLESRFEKPRESPRIPELPYHRQADLSRVDAPSKSVRVMSPREPCSPTRSQTKELAGFLKNTAPVNLEPLGYGLSRSSQENKHNHPRDTSQRSHRLAQKQKVTHSRTPSGDAPQALTLGRTSSLMDRSNKPNGGYWNPQASAVPSRTPSRFGQVAAVPSRPFAHFGVLPDTGPSTPQQTSRSTSMSLASSPRSETSSSSRRPSSSPFSLKRMFTRKGKDFPLYV